MWSCDCHQRRGLQLSRASRCLEGGGRIFRTVRETEVILHLYDELGEDCASQLNGDFSFAIWDTSRKRMFYHMGVRPMGVHPLYYTMAKEWI